jgi:hypothetical protein
MHMLEQSSSGNQVGLDLLMKQGSFCPDGHSSCSERIVRRGSWCRTPGPRLDGKAPRRSFDWRGALLTENDLFLTVGSCQLLGLAQTRLPMQKRSVCPLASSLTHEAGRRKLLVHRDYSALALPDSPGFV